MIKIFIKDVLIKIRCRPNAGSRTHFIGSKTGKPKVERS